MAVAETRWTAPHLEGLVIRRRQEALLAVLLVGTGRPEQAAKRRR
jgi:hypothetical protein